MERDYWPRLREAAKPYDNFGTFTGREWWAIEMLADILAYLEHQEPACLEIHVAHALHKAGLRVKTGKLRIEQEIWARKVSLPDENRCKAIHEPSGQRCNMPLFHSDSHQSENYCWSVFE